MVIFILGDEEDEPPDDFSLAVDVPTGKADVLEEAVQETKVEQPVEPYRVEEVVPQYQYSSDFSGKSLPSSDRFSAVNSSMTIFRSNPVVKHIEETWLAVSELALEDLVG